MSQKQIIKKVNDLILEAYHIAQKENHTYTYDEAKQYDPLISTLFEALQKSDELVIEDFEN